LKSKSETLKRKEKRIKKMLNYYVKPATKKEIAIYEKVEKAFDTMEVIEKVLDFFYEEDMHDTLKNRIANEEFKALIKSYGLTEKEVCIWYFVEEA
jgi:hypothetical protein